LLLWLRATAFISASASAMQRPPSDHALFAAVINGNNERKKHDIVSCFEI
jgi:hypothetical protein